MTRWEAQLAASISAYEAQVDVLAGLLHKTATTRGSIASCYTIDRELGRGACGAVRLAFDKRDDEQARVASVCPYKLPHTLVNTLAFAPLRAQSLVRCSAGGNQDDSAHG